MKCDWLYIQSLIFNTAFPVLLDETINALAMASPFTLEEKQILLEAKNLDNRKSKIAEILATYTHDNFNNTTVQWS